MEKASSNYTVMIIKPDAMKDILSNMIIVDIESEGFEVIARKELKLTRRQAEFLYSDHINYENYEYAVNSLLQDENEHSSTILVLRCPEGKALKNAQSAKGRADKEGIRAKYRKYLWYELMEQEMGSGELKMLLSKNRVHVPTTDRHAREIVKSLFSKQEMEDILGRDPEAVGFIDIEHKRESRLISARVSKEAI